VWSIWHYPLNAPATTIDTYHHFTSQSLPLSFLARRHLVWEKYWLCFSGFVWSVELMKEICCIACT
jgi:hypothetical protein